MNAGTELKLRGGGNVYLVKQLQDRHVLLECVWFSDWEDLGDGIFCLALGQEIWVAAYHAQHYEQIGVTE